MQARNKAGLFAPECQRDLSLFGLKGVIDNIGGGFVGREFTAKASSSLPPNVSTASETNSRSGASCSSEPSNVRVNRKGEKVTLVLNREAD